MKNPTSGNAKHFIALDSLRGLAAITVALFHIEWPNYLTKNHFVGHGFLMVDFFFVLSGFVIAFNYMGRITDAASLGRFMWLRFWRLYPLHLCMLIVFVAIEVLKYLAQARFGIVANEAAFTTSDAGSFILQVLLVHGWFPTAVYSFNNVSWSISLEFYTYLAFALCVLTRKPLLVAGLIAAAGAAAIAQFGAPFISRCLYGFFVGVLTFPGIAAFKGKVAPGVLSQLAPLLLAILMVFAISYVASDAVFFYLPLVAALFIISIILCPDSFFVKMLKGRFLVWLGTLSYSIYMTHGAILWLFNQSVRLWAGHLAAGEGLAVAVPPLTGTILAMTFLCLTIGVSHYTYAHIEAPWRAWSKRDHSGSRIFRFFSKASSR